MASKSPKPFHWHFIRLGVGIAFLLALTLATIGSPGGLGIHEQISVKVERDRNWRVSKYSIENTNGKTVWDWLELIGVPITLAALGIWFQSQEQKRASLAAEEQRRLATEENKEEILQRYLDRVSQLLIERDLIRTPKVANNSVVESASEVIRARTLSVLRSFFEDGERKASVVFFLIETDVLHRLKVSLAGSQLAASKLAGASLSGVNLAKATLVEADMKRADLRGADFSGADLRGVDLRKADLSNAKLKGANLRYANLFDANLSGADLSCADLSLADLSAANFSGANLNEANFRYAKLIEANLSGVNLRESKFRGADLSGVNFSNACLTEVDLSEVNLSAANLMSANLIHVNLLDANLSEAKLIGAKLSVSNLARANLSKANLNRASLFAVILEGANLYDARWDDHTIWHSQVDEAKNIPEALKEQLGI